MNIDLSNYTAPELRNLRDMVNKQLEVVARLARQDRVTPGCIISVKNNNKVKSYRSGGAYARGNWLRYKVVKVNDTHMTVTGPINCSAMPKKTASLPKEYLNAILKRA